MHCTETCVDLHMLYRSPLECFAPVGCLLLSEGNTVWLLQFPLSSVFPLNHPSTLPTISVISTSIHS